jgi:hypothetical protein
MSLTVVGDRRTVEMVLDGTREPPSGRAEDP